MCPKVSVITVCYNAEELIENTIKSVLGQTYKNIEYIIIDGNSTDGTLNIIIEYEPRFNGKMKWISEKDKGIYDAMNKGLNLSNGNYIFFLNSGDFFLDKDIINHMVVFLEKYNVDFLYGDVNLGEGKIRKGNVKSGLDLIFRTICHQSILAHKKCFEENKFDDNYKWLADYKWVIKCFNNPNIKKKYMNEIISYFDPKNNTSLDTYRLNMERVTERYYVGIESFSGIKKMIFKINNCRLYIKYKYYKHM